MASALASALRCANSSLITAELSHRWLRPLPLTMRVAIRGLLAFAGTIQPVAHGPPRVARRRRIDDDPLEAA